MSDRTTADHVLAVLQPGQRVSLPTLLDRLRATGHEPCGMNSALDDDRIERVWRTGKPYSWLDTYDEKNRGPLYLSIASASRSCHAPRLELARSHVRTPSAPKPLPHRETEGLSSTTSSTTSPKPGGQTRLCLLAR